MRMRFLEMQQYVQREVADASADLKTHIKNLINRSQIELAHEIKPAFLNRTLQLVTAADYTTGTVAVSQDSTTITGTGTAWTADMKGRYIQIQRNEHWYRISAVSSATSIVIEEKYQQSSATGVNYTIAQLDHELPIDLMSILSLRQIDSPVQIRWFGEHEFHGRFPRPTATGNPTIAYLIQATEESLYNAGRVEVTLGSPTVTGTGTAWIAAFEGKFFRIAGSSRLYRIARVVSATSMTLTEAYGEASATDQRYDIQTHPVVLFRIYPRAVDRKVLYLKYRRRPKYLYHDDTVCDFGDWAHVVADRAAVAAARLAGRDEARMRQLQIQASESAAIMRAQENPNESRILVMGADVSFQDVPQRYFDLGADWEGVLW